MTAAASRRWRVIGGWWLAACLVAALLAAVSAGSASAAAQKLEDRSYEPHDLLGASAVLIDPQGQWTVDDVRRLDAQGEMQPLTTLFGAGYRTGAFWMRIALEADANTPPQWWLHVNPAYLDDVRMVHVLPDGQAQPEQRDGDRDLNFNPVHRTPTFVVQPQPGRNLLYVRVESTSSISILPTLVPRQLAPRYWQQEYLILGLYTGMEVALVVAAVLGAIMLRHRVYIYFAIFIAAGVLQRFAISGLMHQWWLDHDPLLADTIASSLIGITAAAGAVFFASLFDYRTHHRVLYWVINASAVYMLFTAVAPLLGVFGQLIKGASVLMLVNMLLMFVPLRRYWRTDNPAIRFGVLGFLGYASMVLLSVISLLGLIPPSPEMLRAAQAGSLVLLFLLLLIILLQTTRAQRDREHAEEIATQARAAEERERTAREEQSHLTSMIAHEIRTPVAVIDAALQSLRVLDEEPTPERQLRHERIGRAIERMNTLMELALAQDRLEVDTWSQRLSSVDLAALTRDLTEGMTGRSGERITVTADASCAVQADERMLRFALINLMDNALKYSPRDTPVAISIENQSRDGVAGSVWRIDDRGPGIPPGDRERVFQKYFRAGETTGAPGLGLGLYIVRQIVKRHHGHVVALSGPGGTGTRFECWLPCTPKEPPA